MTQPKKPKVVDLSEFRQTRQAITCKIMAIAKSLVDAGETERAEKLAAALAAEDITHPAVQRVLKSWGHDVSTNVISRHRRGLCSCHSAT